MNYNVYVIILYKIELLTHNKHSNITMSFLGLLLIIAFTIFLIFFSVENTYQNFYISEF